MTNEEFLKEFEDFAEEAEIGDFFDVEIDKETGFLIRVELIKIADTEYFFVGGYGSPGVLIYVDCYEEEDIIKAIDGF